MIKTLYLPGAAGSGDFWRPIAERLNGDFRLFSWPGLGDQPADPGIECIDDLVSSVAQEVNQPVAIVAQSMGGFVALKLALQFPSLVRCLVLAVTSGGVPVQDLGGINWRPNYAAKFPKASKWIASPVEDLSSQLHDVRVPVLLLWGDADPISPVAVGERLLSLLPNACLKVVSGADHDLAVTHAELVALHIENHIAAATRI
ncbi:MAG: alpha/beta hydrolase [Alphaproteobacteria bacterium HGW-Alphaproteobacteria-15]|nr:MAG: alpha/beta hydrolase [Alphaproteobacteria bacterium HGW-Alphaproteobacteria-15]